MTAGGPSRCFETRRLRCAGASCGGFSVDALFSSSLNKAVQWPAVPRFQALLDDRKIRLAQIKTEGGSI